ncbi:hypothetical protein QJQ45_001959 [Haematococcus lacustris]|nr:hypothetical protein QJQ45_001959 [Haematococcus lacustris]
MLFRKGPYTSRHGVFGKGQAPRVLPSIRAQAAATQTADSKPVLQLYKASIDFRAIKDNLPAVEHNTRIRNSKADPRRVVQLYDQFVQLKLETDSLRAERNTNSSQMKGKLEKEQRDKLIHRGQQLKEQLAELEAKLVQVGHAPSFPESSPPKDHVVLAEALDLVDFDAAAEVSGQKFYYLRNAGALLELALVNWAISRVVARGFTPIMTPDLVKETVLEKCGFQPRGEGTQVYSVEDSPLCLTGTAEVPLGGLYMDKVLREAELPIRMVAYGHCFRTEAGAAGAAGKGLYRVHQFSKVEMFVLSTPEQSNALHEELRTIETELFAELGLHFKATFRKYDIEAWMPGLNRYGEISSTSNCTDYQSRRLNIRYRPSVASKADASDKASAAVKLQQGRTEFVHTLNGTACAVPRMIVAILENYQQPDGSVVVPEVLRPFMGGLELIVPPTKL